MHRADAQSRSRLQVAPTEAGPEQMPESSTPVHSPIKHSPPEQASPMRGMR
jgi:hypothetical protein